MIKSPFIVINPKNYFTKKELYEMAITADQLAKKYDITLIMTAPFTELSYLKENTKNILVSAQHADFVSNGTGMGKISVESLDSVGVDVIVLNHAENKLYYSEIINIVKKCKSLGISTIVCSDTLKEAEAIALLSPTVILCEPTELIGSGETSDLSYIRQTNEIIKNIDPNILVEQAAGVNNYLDVYKIIKAGSDGTGATSAFVNSNNRKDKLTEMIKGALDAIKSEKNESN